MSRVAVLWPFCVHDYLVLLLSVRAVRIDPAKLYGVSLPLGAEAKLHRMCTSKLPPKTAPTRAGAFATGLRPFNLLNRNFVGS